MDGQLVLKSGPQGGNFRRRMQRLMAAALLGSLSAIAAPAVLAQDRPPQRLIIKLNDNQFRGTDAYGNALSNHATTARNRITQLSTLLQTDLKWKRTLATGAEVVELTGERMPQELASLIQQITNADNSIDYVEEDRLMQLSSTPNDAMYTQQWDFFETTAGINVQTAWDKTTGTGVVVAVIDTGYRPHADLAANLLPGYDMISSTTVSNDGNGRDSDASDPGDWTTANQCYSGSPAYNSSWHGTHVAGTIAAVTNNSTGVAGVAYGAKVLPVRVLGRCGGYTSDIADAIVWSAGGTVSGVPTNTKPAKVMNLSLGGYGPCGTTTQTAINTARSLGSTIVVAAGNSNDNAANYTPASCTGVITVASVGRTGAKAYYSNYGAAVTIAAPGGDQSTGQSNGILSTLNSGSTTPGSDIYAYYQGTSQATPHVAGVVALLYAAKPTITPDQVKTALTSTARAFPATCSQCGAGIVNAAAAVASVAGTAPKPTEMRNNIAVSGLSGTTNQDLAYLIAVPAGATNLSIKMSGGTGEADLYVRFGSQPTTTTYNCRPYLTGNNETCTFAAPQAGTYYINVHGRATFSGVSLVASYLVATTTACATGYTKSTGTISAVGGSVFLPSSSTSFTIKANGYIVGGLAAASGTNFDLALQRLSGTTWSSIATSATASTSSELIDYSATTGNSYRWKVSSVAGTGAFTLCTLTP